MCRTFKIIRHLFLVFLATSFIAGCNEKASRLYPFGWEATGAPSDSLLVKLDRNVMTYGDPEELKELASAYCTLSAKEDPEGLYRHRSLYWEGTALFMSGEFERGDSLRHEALLQCDSIRFPRDFRMYRMATEQPSDFNDNVARYNRYVSDLELFLKSSDPVSAFSRAVQLSGLMTEAGMHTQAMGYALMADSLLGAADLPTLRANNRVNVASCQFLSGDTVGATATLRQLRASTDSLSNPIMTAIIDFNLHQISGDTEALLKSWNTVKSDDNLLRMRPLVAAALITEAAYPEADSEDAASVMTLAYDFAYTPEELLSIARARAHLALSSHDQAIGRYAFKEYEKAVTTYNDELKHNELITAETARQISEAQHLMQVKQLRKERRFWTTLSLLTVALLAAALIILKIIHRFKRLQMLRQLEHERLRRTKLALELMMAEKEYSTPASDPDGEFMKRFMEAYPKVGKAGRRLALLIWQGADTSEIAKAMNIRKESVMQGRWRLRTQMNLSPDEDLDVTIANLR